MVLRINRYYRSNENESYRYRTIRQVGRLMVLYYLNSPWPSDDGMHHCLIETDLSMFSNRIRIDIGTPTVD